MAKETYSEALKKVLEHEGGYSNHPSDPGGPTNYGITINDYRMYIDKNGTAESVKNMNVEQAKKIYKEKYWDIQNCDLLPAGLDYAVFDYGVNSGIGRSGKILRGLLGLPTDTHKIDQTVINAANKADTEDLIIKMMDERLRFLKGLKTWPVFGKGWGRRVVQVQDLALELMKKYSSNYEVQQMSEKLPWLDTAISLISTKEVAGSANNPKILQWAKDIGGWVASFYKEDSIPWCGLFVGHCLQANDIKPPADMLSALAWNKYGSKLDEPMYGCIIVFKRGGGFGHVGFAVSQDSDTYHVLGGNQSDAVNVSRIVKDRCVGFRWPEYYLLPKTKLPFRQFNGKVTSDES